MVSNTTPTPLCASLGCVHPHNEGLHRGLLSRRDPSVRSAPLACHRSSCHSRLVLFSFTGLVIVARCFPSRVLVTFSLALHAGCSSHAFELCRSVFLLNAAVFVDLALYLAVCGLASVELSCSLSLSSSPARDLQHKNLTTALLSARGRHSLHLATELLSARGRASVCSGPCCESSSGSSVLLMTRVNSLQFPAQL